MPAVGSHYRPAKESLEDGVYRVVGTADPVVLLRVADGDGRRIHTGQVVQLSPAELAADFEQAADPDAGIAPVSALHNALQGLYWTFRRFL